MDTPAHQDEDPGQGIDEGDLQQAVRQMGTHKPFSLNLARTPATFCPCAMSEDFALGGVNKHL